MIEAADPSTQPVTVRIKEACRITGIDRSKLYELIADGEIEIIKVGAMTLAPVSGLKQFVAKHKRGAITGGHLQAIGSP